MLIITRKQGQAVHVQLDGGPRITLHYLGIHGNRAKIGIDAPKDHDIWRDEIDRSPAGEDNPQES
jgi:carbon storage regulator CsrA